MEDTQPVEVLSHTTRIVMLAMAIVMTCISIVAFVIVLNERSTQQNADRESQQNAALLEELQCLRNPAFEADKADSELSITIARALVALGNGDNLGLTHLVDDLAAKADLLEDKLRIREESLTNCRQS